MTATAASAAVHGLLESIMSPLSKSYGLWSALPIQRFVCRAPCREASAGFSLPQFLALPQLPDQLLADDGNLPGAVRNQENHEEEEHAEHRAGEPLGDAFGNVGHEDDEG